jgi:hypothetical protein
MATKKLSTLLVLCFTLAITLALTAPQLHAQKLAPVFTTIDVAGAGETDANDINTAGTIVGFSLDPTLSIGTGFIDTNGTFTSVKVPKASDTRVYGINDAGDIVGWYIDTAGITHGFHRTAAGKLSKIDPPGSTTTNAWSINSAGTIVGTYVGSDGIFHGFTLIGTTYTSFDAPNGAILTEFTGINNAGTSMVGIYDDSAGEEHGFQLTGSTFTTIDPPGSNTTATDRINDKGAVVGLFCAGTACVQNAGPFSGYLKNPKYHKINFPSATETRCRGLNNAGNIVGRYTDSSGVIHGMMVAF